MARKKSEKEQEIPVEERKLIFEVKKVEYQSYLDQRKQLAELNTEASRRFDHWICNFSGGMLALSVTFIHNVASSPITGSEYLLFFSWGLLVLTIVCSLLSQIVSMNAAEKRIEELDASATSKMEEIKKESEEETSKPKLSQETRRDPTNLIKKLNYWAMFLFVVAATCMAIFSGLNVLASQRKVDTMSKDKSINLTTTTNPDGQCGVTPPPPATPFPIKDIIKPSNNQGPQSSGTSGTQNVSGSNE